MPWFYVDDQFHSHPKAKAAGLEGVGLWTITGSWSSAYKQNGHVPYDLANGWRGGKRAAASLVDAGLWVPNGTGWDFHQWDHFQRDADEIEAIRAKARERQRRRRKRLAEPDEPDEEAP